MLGATSFYTLTSGDLRKTVDSRVLCEREKVQPELLVNPKPTESLQRGRRCGKEARKSLCLELASDCLHKAT